MKSYICLFFACLVAVVFLFFVFVFCLFGVFCVWVFLGFFFFFFGGGAVSFLFFGWVFFHFHVVFDNFWVVNLSIMFFLRQQACVLLDMLDTSNCLNA